MRSPERLNCDNAGHPPCNKDGRVTLKFNYGKIPNLKDRRFFNTVDGQSGRPLSGGERVVGARAEGTETARRTTRRRSRWRGRRSRSRSLPSRHRPRCAGARPRSWRPTRPGLARPRPGSPPRPPPRRDGQTGWRSRARRRRPGWRRRRYDPALSAGDGSGRRRRAEAAEAPPRWGLTARRDRANGATMPQMRT